MTSKKISGKNIGNETKKLLASLIQKNQQKVFEWQLEHVRRNPPPFYCSVDLRDSGHKIVPVDSNLYPAGFNNICPEDQRAAPPVVRAHISGVAAHLEKPMPTRVLILPESHTSNGYYIENLYYLTQILTNAGFEVRVGWFGEIPDSVSRTPDGAISLLSVTQKEIHAYPIVINQGEVTAGDFVPDMILLNNDFSSGYPTILDSVKQPILPSHTLGWHSRKKSTHFVHYNRLAAEFAAIIGIDPWTIQIDTEEVGPVNFNEGQGLDLVAASVSRILERTQTAYASHEVDQPPFVFVKNNAGTYGMGIMVVHSADEILSMNRRSKNKMSVGKNHIAIESVVVQEGIPTVTLVDRLAAEPVIYLVGGNLIGGFLRTNTQKGVEDNLNSQGMVFRKLCMSDLKRAAIDLPENSELNLDDETQDPVLELVYGSIARISAMASGIELQGTLT